VYASSTTTIRTASGTSSLLSACSRAWSSHSRCAPSLSRVVGV